jgi:dethiobiotin synthetase
MTCGLQPGLFVTGTDTGAGKTVVAAAIIRSLAASDLRVAGMKPVSAGSRHTRDGLRNDDALALIQAANVVAAYEVVNPYCFAAPIAPHIAARDTGVVIDIELIRERFNTLASTADCVVVEGAGGWLAPIGPAQTMADVAAALALPVVLVVALRLGCLNHALLTARALAGHGAGLAGWIGNSIDPDFKRAADNVAALAQLLGAAPVAVLPYAPQAIDILDLPPGAALRLMAPASSSVTPTRGLL